VSVPRPIRTVAVVTATSSREADGIRDHTDRLIESLRSDGVTVHVLERPISAWGARLRRVDVTGRMRLRDLDAIVVQYNPFWYGRRGFAPGLALALLGLALRAPQAVRSLLVHENYIDARDWRTTAMSAWQRVQLMALQALAHVSFGTIGEWTRLLRRDWPFRPAHHLPVGSNFPDRRDARAAGRAELGVADDEIVLGVFGLSHAGRLEDHVRAAVRAVAATGRRVVLVNLGSGERGTERLDDRAEIRSPGFLDDQQVPQLVAATDVFLAGYEDGVSTRRTTVMAALQHGVPVVGTSGHLTDAVLAEASDAIRLTPVGDPDAFARAVSALAADPAERARLGAAGRRLYETTFDWPRISHRLLDVLVDAR
jgi:glycosyltransferase involved in cell wall biosynthesis